MAKIPVTAQTRNAVWNELIDAERHIRYCGALSRRYQCWDRTIKILLLGFAASGFTSLVAQWPVTIQHVATIAIVLVVAWDLLLGYERKYATLEWVIFECQCLKNEYQDLWLSLGHVDAHADDDKVTREISRLAARSTRVLDRAKLESSEDRALNQRVTEESYKVEASRYAAV